ncbi:hypothetical protein Asulf_02004 [Archaeoglobus sulfaticallidus PM70-1]|uniref:Uncharacterized protein n=1 Tax=Archaeoglobus sulfaticallidus PM70-1 TaxID=387631 RepID=N0BEC7_9EURY|nr:hypothetical protein [Archaeoglobus sulfaticallidus]AGK61969.1 hypothetical protein Asulf_02004 [Archaeoglobus sulfaticallidus PM70-1]
MYPYPIEVLSDTYVSKLGGFSEILSKRELGINAEAVLRNTSIILGETKARLKFMDSRNPPFFLRKEFSIVGITEAESPNGEVVLSDRLEEEFRDYLMEDVVINTIESFRLRDDYSAIMKRIKEYLQFNED